MYVCADDLDADSADPLTRSLWFQAVVEATSFVNPVDEPTDFPDVEGSEMVDIHVLDVVACFEGNEWW